ncbi:MAG TPA: ATP-binding protein [Polyangiaceae bacterium]
MSRDRRFEALAEVEDLRALLEGLFAHAPVAFQIYTEEGHSLVCNDAFVKLFGSEPPPEYSVFEDQVLERQGFTDLVRRAFAGETIRLPAHWYDPRELRHLEIKESNRVAIEVTMVPLRGREGSIKHIALCIKDVTSEFRLAISEARYRTQVETAPEAVVTLDIDTGRFVEVNQNAVELFGYPREVLLTKHPLDVSPEVQADGGLSVDVARENIERTMRGERMTFEWLHQNAAGAVIPCEIRLVRLPGEHENLCRGSIVDISERKRLERQLQETEEQLRQSQKLEAIGRLAGGVAHDFNNLLSVIIGCSALLMDDLKTESRMRLEVEAIRKAGERAAELTHQLLAFSRRQMLVPKVLSLDAVVREAESILRRLLGEDVELVTECDAELVKVRVDPGQMHQLVMNLAVNARDAMPDGGRLTLAARNEDLADEALARRLELAPGRYAVLEVTDDGVGMDKATQVRIFEPFFTTKGVGEGSGLGLSTVFGIVKQSGGGIVVESEPGRGTRFRIYFPEVLEPVAPSLPPPPVESSRGDETVLLVEDQEDVRAVVRDVLTRQGYRVVEARNGTEALLVSERYSSELNLLITDLVMPGMSGTELADRMRRRCPALPVLYVSGYPKDANLRMDEGRVDFLPKPIAPQVLAVRVRKLLARARR